MPLLIRFICRIQQQLTDFLNEKIMNAPYERDASVGPPVLVSEVTPDKSFAFVEFKTPRDAAICLAFDGVSLFGQSLRIRRPKDYVPTGDERDGSYHLYHLIVQAY